MAKNGKLKVNTLGEVNLLHDLPEEMQRQMYAELSAKFDPIRIGSEMSRETKVKTVAAVLQVLSGLPMPQQRAILMFALDVLALASDRWWRKPTIEKSVDGGVKEVRP